MRPVNRGAIPVRETARGVSKRRVIDFSYYRPDLVANLGEYCSYCEVPLGVNLAVEHMLSKVNSINADDWNNLLLACTNCNSHKQSKTKSESALNNFYWPSNRYVGLNTFGMLTYAKAAKTVKRLSDDGVFRWPPSSRPQNLYPNRDTQTYDYVWVYPSAAYDGDNAKKTKIKNTILLTGLNDFTPNDADPKASDRRVYNRTVAWDRADAMATQLASYYNAPMQDPAAINLLKAQVKEAAKATGFWSVWMTVFKSKVFVDVNTRKQLLNELFANKNVFPGTAYTAT